MNAKKLLSASFQLGDCWVRFASGTVTISFTDQSTLHVGDNPWVSIGKEQPICTGRKFKPRATDAMELRKLALSESGPFAKKAKRKGGAA